jgi:hypothetical protein
VRNMGPWLEANGIYPIFLVWQTGFFETAQNVIEAAGQRLLGIQKPQVGGGDPGWTGPKGLATCSPMFTCPPAFIIPKLVWPTFICRGGLLSGGHPRCDPVSLLRPLQKEH